MEERALVNFAGYNVVESEGCQAHTEVDANESQ